MISVSIVSHGHGAMVLSLIESLLRCPEVIQIIITKNIPESLQIPRDPRIRVLDNPHPKGFGENHNAAFKLCQQPFFCPLNPDISLIDNPFANLLKELQKSGAGIVAPLVISPSGLVEDSVRRYPTITSLLCKVFGGDGGRYNLSLNDPAFSPDWFAGMCMLFRREAYESLEGFDTKFFLYYEDVDICMRARKSGIGLMVCPSVAVIHDARRDSHRNFRHLLWHLKSMARYFIKHWGRMPGEAC
ncbi:MAG: glycosyltransferase family 2 protein [Azonexus sp.]